LADRLTEFSEMKDIDNNSQSFQLNKNEIIEEKDNNIKNDE
jgi:hypothetical protein